MNIICSPLRSTLTVKHMSSLIFVSNVGPPVKNFVPGSYVRSWLAKGRRASECKQGMERNVHKTSVKHKLWGLLA